MFSSLLMPLSFDVLFFLPKAFHSHFGDHWRINRNSMCKQIAVEQLARLAVLVDGSREVLGLRRWWHLNHVPCVCMAIFGEVSTFLVGVEASSFVVNILTTWAITSLSSPDRIYWFSIFFVARLSALIISSIMAELMLGISMRQQCYGIVLQIVTRALSKS